MVNADVKSVTRVGQTERERTTREREGVEGEGGYKRYGKSRLDVGHFKCAVMKSRELCETEAGDE